MRQIKESYDGVRKDLFAFSGVSFCNATVLDVGCYRGSNARYLKNKFVNVFYVGIENDPIALSEMDSHVDEVLDIDLDFFSAEVLVKQTERRVFDIVILGDVLEHLKDPGKLLREIIKVTDENSTLVVSIPNVQYYETFLMLFIGRFPRRARGLFDKTHLRWFTKREFVDLVKRDYQVVVFKRVFRLIERPSRINRLVPVFLPFLWILAPFFTFQMYFALKKR